MEACGGLKHWEITFVCANSVTFVCRTKDLRGYIETRNKWQNRDLTVKAWNEVEVFLQDDGFHHLSTLLESPSYAHITSLITPEALTNLTMTKKSPKSVPKIQTEPVKTKPVNNSIKNVNSLAKPVNNAVNNTINNSVKPKTIQNNTPKKESSLINQIGMAMRDKMTKTEEKLFKTDCQSELEQMAFGKSNENSTNGKKVEAKVEKGKDRNVNNKGQGSSLKASSRASNLIFSVSKKIDPKTIVPEKKVEIKVEEKVPEKKVPPKEIKEIKEVEKKKIEIKEKRIEVQEEKSKAEKKKEKKQRQKDKKKEVNGEKGVEVESEEEEEMKVEIENEQSNESLETLQLECKRLQEKIQRELQRETLVKKRSVKNGSQSSLEKSVVVTNSLVKPSQNSVNNQNAQSKVAKKEKEKKKEKEVVVEEESSLSEEEEELEVEDERSENSMTDDIEFDGEQVPAFIQKLYHKSGKKNEVKPAKKTAPKNEKLTSVTYQVSEEENLKSILQALKTDKACLDKACEVTMKGKWKVAVACFTKAIELQPFNIGHYLNRCFYHLRTGSYNLALNDASYVIQKTENIQQIALAKFRAGQAWYALKNFDEAEKSVLESVEFWPENLIFIRELLCMRMKQLLVMGFSRKSIFEVLYTSQSFSDACNKLSNGKFNFEEDPPLIPITRESEIYYSDDEDEVDYVDSLTKLTSYHHNNRKKKVSDENFVNNKFISTNNLQRKKVPPNNILKEPNVKTVPVMKDPVINYKDYEDKCLFLGNLNSSVTTTQLKKKFTCYGKILSVVQPPGVNYAFINFENPINLKDVLTKEQNCKVNDIKITVRPKPKKR